MKLAKPGSIKPKKATQTKKPKRITRKATIEGFYTANYGVLIDYATEYDISHGLLPLDTDAILNHLAGRLPEYRGTPDEPSFLVWCRKIIKKATEAVILRHALKAEPSLLRKEAVSIIADLTASQPTEPLDFVVAAARDLTARKCVLAVAILKKHQRVIDYAIWNEMGASYRDWSVEHQDVSSDIALLIFKYAFDFSKAGTALAPDRPLAGLPHRLRKLVHRHFVNYYATQDNRRLEIVTEFQTSLGRKGCEILPPEEIASNRGDWMDEAA